MEDRIAEDFLLRAYAFLVRLYPSAYRRRFGASMEQTFADLCNERRARQQSLFFFSLSLYSETLYAVAIQHLRSNDMTNDATSPRRRALWGILLITPFAWLLGSLVFSYDPGVQRWLERVVGDPLLASRFGSIFVLALFACVFVAAWINLKPVVRAARSGEALMAHPLNLALAVIALAIILFFISAFVVDQWPCWMGVPNCD